MKTVEGLRVIAGHRVRPAARRQQPAGHAFRNGVFLVYRKEIVSSERSTTGHER